MKKTVITILSAFMLISIANVVNAENLTVTGKDAQDVEEINKNLNKSTTSVSTCVEKNMTRIKDDLKLANYCICTRRNNDAISALKITKSIFTQHPEWQQYSVVQVMKTNNTIAINPVAFNTLFQSLTCIR